MSDKPDFSQVFKPKGNKYILTSIIGFLLLIPLLGSPAFAIHTFAQRITASSSCKIPLSFRSSSQLENNRTISSNDPVFSITPQATTLPVTISPIPTVGLNPDILFNRINNYRKQFDLPSFQKDATTCKLAADRSPELYNEIFVTHTLHKGMYDRNLPYWNTENVIAMDTETNAFNWWIADPMHKKAILGNFIYSCIACKGYTCDEEFTNYQQKQ